MTPRHWPSLWVSVGASFAVAGLGASLTDLGDWYQTLQKPPWKPPDQAFGLIWSVIFSLCAVSAWLAWHHAPTQRLRAWVVGLFGLNAALNVLWSAVYFHWHLLGWAILEVIFLWLSIALLMAALWRIYRPSAWLLLPYLVWVSAAGVLNWDTWQLNRPASQPPLGASSPAKDLVLTAHAARIS